MGTTGFIHPLFNWIPYKLIEKDGTLFFEWIYLGEKRFTDPFFDDTIARCKSHPYNSTRYKILSTAANLLEWATEISTVPLSGLVFHVSRCGSTMVSQLLAIPSSTISISEAPVIDQILRSEYFNPSEKAGLIDSVFKFFGQKRFEEETQLIVKMDAWHLFEIENMRMFFTYVPFAILYRKPIEVLKSHKRLRGMHMIPNVLPLAVFGFDAIEIKSFSLDQFGIRVLEKYFQVIVHFSAIDTNTMIFDYQKGIGNIIGQLDIYFNIHYTQDEYVKIKERLKLHSKYPEGLFQQDEEVQLEYLDFTYVNNLYEEMTLTSG